MTTPTLEKEISELKQYLAAINLARVSFIDFPNETERRNYLLDGLIVAYHPYLKSIYDHVKSELDGEFKRKEIRLVQLQSQRNDNEGKSTMNSI